MHVARRLLVIVAVLVPLLVYAQTIHKETVIWDFVNGVKSHGVFLEPGGGGGGGGGSITIKEADDAPYVSDMNTLIVPNGSLTDNGAGVVTLEFSPFAASNGANCDPGLFPAGVDAAGDVEECITLSGVNAQTSAYQVLASDFQGYKTIVVASGTFTITLVASGAQPPDGMYITIVNYGSGVVTITRSGQLLNGGTTDLILPASTSVDPSHARIISDGTNYIASVTGATIPFAKLPLIDSETFVARQTAGTGPPEQVSAANARVILDINNVDNTSDATKNSAAATLTNKIVLPRITTPTITSDAITPDLDVADIFVLDAISADLTINCPVSSVYPVANEQWLMYRFKTSTPRLLTWNACHTAEHGIALPLSTTGDGTTVDRIKFMYNSTTGKYGLVASTIAIAKGITTLASANTFTCPANTSSQCQMSMAEVAGTLTVAAPSGTPTDGQLIMLLFRCTNAQTFSFNAIFINSPNVTLPTSCPADTTKFTAVGARYSTILTKWQALATN